MSSLGLSASETVFWLIALVLVVVVVFGAVAVLVMLLSMLRSISQSMAELREVVQAQSTQPPAEQQPDEQQPAVAGEAAEHGTAGPGPATSTDGAAQPDRAADSGDAKDGEAGRRPRDGE